MGFHIVTSKDRDVSLRRYDGMKQPRDPFPSRVIHLDDHGNPAINPCRAA